MSRALKQLPGFINDFFAQFLQNRLINTLYVTSHIQSTSVLREGNGSEVEIYALNWSIQPWWSMKFGTSQEYHKHAWCDKINDTLKRYHKLGFRLRSDIVNS